MPRLRAAVSLARAESESDLQRRTLDLARLTGWKAMHMNDSRRQVGGRLIGDADAAGWPDLVLAHPRRGLCLVIELKSEVGRVSDSQQEWLLTLAKCGIDARVWRPSDWPQIENVLTGKPPRPSQRPLAGGAGHPHLEVVR
jgi:hypothetical protein